jgi:TPR repeat protein|tara:strand:+ start:131 stop:376 length:246 start_codon:yes stop_codon:yes gene_type:complete
MKKATEDQFNELHSLVTEEFLSRVRSGTASTQDLKAACEWLKTNDISGIAYDGNPLDKLANILPKVDPDLINQRMYGKIIN